MEREKLAKAKRIVIKVGSSTITYPNGKVNYEKIESWQGLWRICRTAAMK